MGKLRNCQVTKNKRQNWDLSHGSKIYLLKRDKKTLWFLPLKEGRTCDNNFVISVLMIQLIKQNSKLMNTTDLVFILYYVLFLHIQIFLSSATHWIKSFGQSWTTTRLQYHSFLFRVKFANYFLSTRSFHLSINLFELPHTSLFWNMDKMKYVYFYVFYVSGKSI